MKRAWLLVVIAIFVSASLAHAEDWSTTKTVCHDGVSSPRPLPPPQKPEPAWRLHTLEECGLDFFTLNPVGPTLGNIGTGGGMGGGLHAVFQPNANRIWTFKGLYSINNSNVLSGQYRMVFPPIHKVQAKGRNGRAGQIDETRAKVDLNVVRIDLHSQDFYGIGPDSKLAGHAVYRQQEWWAGVNGYTPLAYAGPFGVLGIFGEAQYVKPVIKGVSGDALPSVVTLYGEGGAPGSLNRPDFVVVGGGFSIRTPSSKPRIWEDHQAAIKYDHYFDTDSGEFAFDRLEGWGNVSLKVLHAAKSKPGQRFARIDRNDRSDRPWWKDAICMQTVTGACEAGIFTFGGRVTTSYTGRLNEVPFYFQPTLGGADFDGVDTLRGLVDYRLRAPNRMLMQVDFDKAIAQIGLKGHPIGEYGLYAFFDAGNVSETPGGLLDNGLRKDVGVGASISIQNKVVLRFYIAFGAGEGSHPNAKFGNAFSNGNTAAVP
jgi:hypothetical protein